MSRVEPSENPSERHGSEPMRAARNGRNGESSRRDLNPERTPSKAEGEVGDVEEALRHQQE